MRTTVLLIMLLAGNFLTGVYANSPKTVPADKNEFTVHRGLNIAHWLSQSEARGQERANYFTEKDIKFLADAGYDHLRIPIDEEQMFSKDGKPDPEAFKLLHNGLKWCAKYNLKAIIDLHILRSHHFNEKVKPLFTDAAAQERFYECWRLLSKELKKYPNNMVAYELMNEPVADDAETWNMIANKCAAVVRKSEPNRTIVIGSNRWQGYETIKDLRVPENDKHILISFHYYLPFLLTHYRALWTENKEYTGPVHYPGIVIHPEDLQQQPEAVAKKFKWYTTQTFNKEVMKSHFQQVLDHANQLGLRVYCGEYACLETAPDADRMRWYQDICSAFEEMGIAHATWDYKEDFGIFKDGKPYWELIEIQTNKPHK